jgi:hypothetical protein
VRGLLVQTQLLPISRGRPSLNVQVRLTALQCVPLAANDGTANDDAATVAIAASFKMREIMLDPFLKSSAEKQRGGMSYKMACTALRHMSVVHCHGV